MGKYKKKAVLTVYFGTAVRESREKTIDCIERKIQSLFPEYAFYHAWTSDIMRRIAAERENLVIPDVNTAMEQMLADGVTEAAVLPLFMVQGLEYEQAVSGILEYREEFEHLRVGGPLLRDENDIEEIAVLMAETYQQKPNQTVIFVGHGTDNEANAVYQKLGHVFTQFGRMDLLTGTVKDKHALERIRSLLKGQQKQRVLLVPFMIAAGNHVKHEMAGTEADSWKSRLEAEGFIVDCVMKGLGEEQRIQDIFIKRFCHIQEIMQESILF